MSKAGTTTKAIKCKAAGILSTRKKKKANHIAYSEDCDQMSTDNSDSHPVAEALSQHSDTGSIIEIPNEENSDEELCK